MKPEHLAAIERFVTALDAMYGAARPSAAIVEAFHEALAAARVAIKEHRNPSMREGSAGNAALLALANEVVQRACDAQDAGFAAAVDRTRAEMSEAEANAKDRQLSETLIRYKIRLNKEFPPDPKGT